MSWSATRDSRVQREKPESKARADLWTTAQADHCKRLARSTIRAPRLSTPSVRRLPAQRRSGPAMAPEGAEARPCALIQFRQQHSYGLEPIAMVVHLRAPGGRAKRSEVRAHGQFLPARTTVRAIIPTAKPIPAGRAVGRPAPRAPISSQPAATTHCRAIFRICRHNRSRTPGRRWSAGTGLHTGIVNAQFPGTITISVAE